MLVQPSETLRPAARRPPVRPRLAKPLPLKFKVLLEIVLSPARLGALLATGRGPRFGVRLNSIRMTPILMIPLLTAVGLAGFWLFYRSVDFFDRI